MIALAALDHSSNFRTTKAFSTSWESLDPDGFEAATALGTQETTSLLLWLLKLFPLLCHV